MTRTPAVVWFKRDLRVEDHAALCAAAEEAEGAPLVPLYIIEPDLWQQPDASLRHWRYLQGALAELQQTLAQHGAPLVIRRDGAVDVLAALREALGPFRLYSHEETGNGWSFRRDLAVAEWCCAQGIVWQEFPSHGVVRRLKSRDGWASLREQRMAAPPLRAPAFTGIDELHSDALPDAPSPALARMVIGDVQAGGRREALRTLESFLKERGRRYMQTISRPGVSARHCSRLSAHIAYGALSVREVEQATKAKIRSLSGNPDPEAAAFARNLAAFLSRLAWRCHFVQKLEQQPEIEYRCMHPAFEGLRESQFREDFFDAWAQGRTGYPLVDACMRSLHENGWLTFRMRAMVVSFASYHLWLDWRQTAPFLATLFTDYEPGIHYAQFQMQSGVTGINAVRMYNPIKQSLEQDPHGRFIRRFVPELAQVPDAFLHEPWRLDALPADYPRPIVAHEPAIRQAREALARCFRQDGFADEARRVRRQLGSRARPANRRPRTARTAEAQLRLDL